MQWNFGISTSLAVAVAEHSSEDLKSFHSHEQRFLPWLHPCDPFFELFRVNPASRHYSIGEISAAVSTVTNSLATTSENRVEVKGTLIQLVRLTIILFSTTEDFMIINGAFERTSYPYNDIVAYCNSDFVFLFIVNISMWTWLVWIVNWSNNIKEILHSPSLDYSS